MEDTPELREKWMELYKAVMTNYGSSMESTTNEDCESESSASYAVMIKALIPNGRRPKDAIFNLLIDALSFKFCEMEEKIFHASTASESTETQCTNQKVENRPAQDSVKKKASDILPSTSYCHPPASIKSSTSCSHDDQDLLAMSQTKQDLDFVQRLGKFKLSKETVSLPPAKPLNYQDKDGIHTLSQQDRNKLVSSGWTDCTNKPAPASYGMCYGQIGVAKKLTGKMKLKKAPP